jgi:hypothetical protein
VQTNPRFEKSLNISEICCRDDDLELFGCHNSEARSLVLEKRGTAEAWESPLGI